MDAFEQARHKYEKNKRSMERSAERKLSAEQPAQLPVLLVPKESISKDCVIEVKVKLPGREFTFSLVKPSVMANMSPGRVSLDEFRNAIVSGLEPLMGRVKVV
jgi:hypothetical protein